MQANIKASLAYIQPDSVFCHNIFVYLHEHTKKTNSCKHLVHKVEKILFFKISRRWKILSLFEIFYAIVNFYIW